MAIRKASDDDWEGLSSYVAQQLTAEYQAKSSLEARASAIITASLGFATLFLALRLQFDLGEALKQQPFRGLVVTSLILLGLAVLISTFSILPWLYESPDIDDLKSFAQELESDTVPQSVAASLAFAQVSELKSISAANAFKAWTLFGAVALLATAVIFLSVVLLLV